MKIPAKIVITAALSALSGCIEDSGGLSDRPISFESSIASPGIELNPGGKASTRASGTGWHADDVIGVYMIEAGGTIAGNRISANVTHRHSGEGRFAAEPGRELFYPETGSVDFVAYHPRRTTYDDHRYPIDVADQSDHPAIDLLYSDNATGHSSGDVPLLRFHHMLSKLVFEIENEAGAPLDGAKAVITGLKTRGVFHLSDKTLTLDGGSAAAIALAGVDDGDGNRATARLEAIVLPDTGISPLVAFTFDSGATASLNLSDKTYTGGKVYIYETSVTASGEVVMNGGATIVDWNDRNGGYYLIPKSDPDDDGNGGGDKPDPVKPANQYFEETFGAGGGMGTGIAAYTGWDNPSVKFTDGFDNADIRRTGSLDPHIYFPGGMAADITVSNLPAGRTAITLSYDIAAEKGGVAANRIRVYAGGSDMSPKVTATIPSPNVYTKISISVPDGTTSLRFVSDPEVNNTGMRLDNIRLAGNK